eukprot:TRINITY_DN5737_c0_g1_i1.p1 TRINITY_DN5737_c0_g1~~TRINITY_DN5737_c0_g1_i1.p1  ORF type:complete len:178 (-),score=28.51 TRINITY_DN5737_c0_g1_i1:78-611(-)
MLSQRTIVNTVLLLQFISSGASWNEKQVGRSKYYEELEEDTFLKKVFRADADVVVSIYGDGCEICQQLHGAHEYAAEKVLKRLDKIGQPKTIRFARYDMERWGGKAKMEKKFPLFSDDTLPRMYYVKAGEAKPIGIPHGELGWQGKTKGGKALYKYIRVTTDLPGFGSEAGKKAGEL